MKRKLTLFILLVLLHAVPSAGQPEVPGAYGKIGLDDNGTLFIERRNSDAIQVDVAEPHHLSSVVGNISGTARGIAFDFQDPDLHGTLYYGFIHYNDSRHPMPVWFRSTALITGGKAEINLIPDLTGRFDMIGWQESGMGNMGYRIVDQDGGMIYDGKLAFTGKGPFKVVPAIIEGPFINLLTPGGCSISFKTNGYTKASVVIDGNEIKNKKAALDHLFEISGLNPDQDYEYTVIAGGTRQSCSFHTAPLPGSGTAFSFAYASDSRSGQGGGERDIFGVNAYIMKKIMALAMKEGARFFQFTGDLVNGYLTDKEALNLQYANWKRSVEAYAHYMPVYTGMGNHEALEYWFFDPSDSSLLKIDRFPFETESSEAVFMQNFVMPLNGPDSEDGASYDPDPDKMDFPSYKESVYYYTYDNIAMIVLNSDYLYSSTLARYPECNGNLHGYLMDKQLEWLSQTLEMLEEDTNIDHIFVSLHTPAFPNGGHVADDMWYGGRNDFRPWIAGKPLAKGIIERRDAFLDLLVNKSGKVVAMLTGDEHNYNRMKVNGDVPIYPEIYFPPRISLSGEIWQINNGAAGAPYYAREMTPWSGFVSAFTTQNALVIIHVDGKKVSMEVLNPDTLELIDEAVLRE